MNIKYVIKNGELIESSQAGVLVYNKAMFFDFVVYSNIKVVRGQMFLPLLEIEKLFESAKIIDLQHPFTQEQIMAWMEKLIQKNNLQDALVRLLLIGPEYDSEPMLFLFPVGLTFYPDKYYQEGVKLITFSGERRFPTSKTKDLLLSYLAYRQAARQGALDALLVDQEQNIREGTRSSFFVIKKDTLIVPPKEKVLEGMTRKIILGIAPSILQVKEADIPLAQIGDYDEYFISGTSLNIMPVRQIDNNLVGKAGGEYVGQLRKMFKEYCAKKRG